MKPKHRIFASFMSSLNCTILFLPLFVLKLNGKLLKHWWRSFSLQTDCYYRTDDFRWQRAREAAKLHLSFAKVIVWNFATAESTLEAAKLSSNFSLSTLFYLIAKRLCQLQNWIFVIVWCFCLCSLSTTTKREQQQLNLRQWNMQKLYFINKAVLFLILWLSVVSGVVDIKGEKETKLLDQNSSSDAKWKRNIESEEGMNKIVPWDQWTFICIYYDDVRMYFQTLWCNVYILKLEV